MPPQARSSRIKFLHGEDVCEGVFDGRETIRMPREFLSISGELPQALDPKNCLAHFMVEFGIFLNDHKTGIAVVCYLISLCSALKAQSIDVVKTSEGECEINVTQAVIEISPNPIQKWVSLFFELGYRFLKELPSRRISIIGFPSPVTYGILVGPSSFSLKKTLG